mgnify:CR=1 FL=1
MAELSVPVVKMDSYRQQSLVEIFDIRIGEDSGAPLSPAGSPVSPRLVKPLHFNYVAQYEGCIEFNPMALSNAPERQGKVIDGIRFSNASGVAIFSISYSNRFRNVAS